MRHLTYSNVMASVAVFVALGGGAYAAVHVNGKDIENRTIAGKKIKNNTLGGKQVDEGRLGEVPRAARAGSATTAASADTAASAASATTATRATTADTATTAANAADAATLGGDPPSAFVVSCRSNTTLYGGVCWDDTARVLASWLAASDACGNAGGRLPTLSELVAYTDQPDIQVTDHHWSADVVELSGGAPSAVARNETTQFASSVHNLAYRCVFYRSN